MWSLVRFLETLVRNRDFSIQDRDRDQDPEILVSLRSRDIQHYLAHIQCSQNLLVTLIFNFQMGFYKITIKAWRLYSSGLNRREVNIFCCEADNLDILNNIIIL